MADTFIVIEHSEGLLNGYRTIVPLMPPTQVDPGFAIGIENGSLKIIGGDQGGLTFEEARFIATDVPVEVLRNAARHKATRGDGTLDARLYFDACAILEKTQSHYHPERY